MPKQLPDPVPHVEVSVRLAYRPTIVTPGDAPTWAFSLGVSEAVPLSGLVVEVIRELIGFYGRHTPMTLTEFEAEIVALANIGMAMRTFPTGDSSDSPSCEIVKE